MKIRKATKEGQFYPRGREAILAGFREMEEAGHYANEDFSVSEIYGAVLPHAGHVYSGHQTLPFFEILGRHASCPETFVILHPNHTGAGSGLSIDNTGAWANSLGEVEIDVEFGELMDLPFDGRAHDGEHSAEVLLPYLQHFLAGKDFRILPICMLRQDHESARQVSEAILKAVQLCGRSIMVLASSDFSHFLPSAEGHEKDQKVLDEIKRRNPEALESAVRKHRISVCGYGPIMALMYYCGSHAPDYRTRILARGHSGEVRPSNEVVDYISILYYR